MYGMGPGPGGHGPMGGPHGGPGRGPGPMMGGHGPMGPMGPMHGPMGHMGPMGPMHGRFFLFPFFRSRKSGQSIDQEDEYQAKTRKVQYISSDGRVETHIEYIDEEAERRRNSLWGRFTAWLGKLFD